MAEKHDVAETIAIAATDRRPEIAAASAGEAGGGLASEREQRVDAARRLARERGIDALLVWGRGGGSPERHANLFYLSGYYPGFPTIPDLAGAGGWADQGYGALLIAGEEAIVFADSARVTHETVTATQIVVSSDLVATVARVLAERGLAGARVGLAGSDVMTQRQTARLAAQLPALELHDADALMFSLRRVKSAAEQSTLRRAAVLGREAIEAAIEAAVPGATEADAVAAASDRVLRAGGAPFTAFTDTYGAGGGSTRHRLPIWSSTRQLTGGQLFTVDISGTLDGYLYDLARSTVVGPDRPTAEQERLLSLSRETVDAVVAALRPGVTIGSAVRAGLRVLDAAEGIESGQFTALGHGLGLGFEPPWLTADDESEVVAGMTLAVEKRVLAGQWGATFERDVLVTDDGAVDMAEPLA